MGGTYRIEWDTTANRLEFTLTGIWDMSTMQRWSADYKAAVAKAPRPGWTVLGDLTEHPAQDDQIQAGHEGLMAHSAQQGMRKAALVVPRAVMAMQMKRLAQSSQTESVITFVSTVDEGRRLLGHAAAA